MKEFMDKDFLLETETEADLVAIQNAFPSVEKIGRTQLTFRERKHTQFDVLNFVTNHRIRLSKLDRVEPSLEDLFMEVVDK